jgi:hypothetical protein
MSSKGKTTRQVGQVALLRRIGVQTIPSKGLRLAVEIEFQGGDERSTLVGVKPPTMRPEEVITVCEALEALSALWRTMAGQKLSVGQAINPATGQPDFVGFEAGGALVGPDGTRAEPHSAAQAGVASTLEKTS